MSKLFEELMSKYSVVDANRKDAQWTTGKQSRQATLITNLLETPRNKQMSTANGVGMG